MPIPSIELVGDGAIGILPDDAGQRELMVSLIEDLPKRVCLGRLRPQSQPSCLRLEPYLPSLQSLANTLPAKTNWREKAAVSLARVYMNDTWGCCVFSSKAHMLGVWSANDSDSGGIILATDKEIEKQYFDYTGGRDAGANIARVFDNMKSRGFVAGGKTYKIDGYLAVDHTKPELVKATQAIFGASCIGIDLPNEWRSSAVWDVTNSRIVGGHDVAPIDYDEKGVYVSSWGRVYLMTWAAFNSTRWVSEYYAALAPAWYGSDMIAPTGMKVAELQADLKKIADGIIPDINPPTPDVPVPPNVMRIKAQIGKGAYADGAIVIGSNLMPGDYRIALGGDTPDGPPDVPMV